LTPYIGVRRPVEQIDPRLVELARGHDDEFLERIEKLCQERFPGAVLAREGMEISIGEAI
jgi:hypothetical protein